MIKTNSTSSHRLLFLIVAAGLVVTAQASEVGDTEEIAALRAQYIEAVTSNDPGVVAELMTDDYVMLQPNANGPDTYGKDSYLNYRASLDQVVSLNVDTVRVVTCGDWAFEVGKESMEWTTLLDVPFSTEARVVRVLKQTNDGWRYARTIRAWATDSYIRPPGPGQLFNAGYGTWTPYKQSNADTKLAQEMMDAVTTDTRQLVAGGDMVSPMENIVALPDDSIGDAIGYGQDWEINSRKEYMENRVYAKYTPFDDLRKYFEEGVVCEKDMGFMWGQGITTGSDIVTGERWISSGDFFYLMKKQDGRWRIGPVGMLYNEVK